MDRRWVRLRWGIGNLRRFVGEWLGLLLAIRDRAWDVGSGSSVWVGVEDIRKRFLGVSMDLLR